MERESRGKFAVIESEKHDEKRQWNSYRKRVLGVLLACDVIFRLLRHLATRATCDPVVGL